MWQRGRFHRSAGLRLTPARWGGGADLARGTPVLADLGGGGSANQRVGPPPTCLAHTTINSLHLICLCNPSRPSAIPGTATRTGLVCHRHRPRSTAEGRRGPVLRLARAGSRQGGDRMRALASSAVSERAAPETARPSRSRAEFHRREGPWRSLRHERTSTTERQA